MSGDPQGPFMGAVACMRTPETTFNLLDIQHIPRNENGEYFWTVRVNRQLAGGDWLTTSTSDTPRRIRVSNASGGGSSSGSGGKPDARP